MKADSEELLELVERNAGIQSALVGYLKTKGYLEEIDFIQYCNSIDYQSIRKEVLRGETEARSGNDELHAGGEQATVELCKMSNLKKTDRILDAGTGHGGAARVIAQTFGNLVIGLEMDYVRLINALFRTKQAGLDDLVSFTSGDAYHMPFANDSFDIVIRQHAVYGQCETQFIKECFRVLKPGGRIAFQGILKRVPFSSVKVNMEDYTIDEYCKMMEINGFREIILETEESTKELKKSFHNRNSFMLSLAEKNIIAGIKIIATKNEEGSV